MKNLNAARDSINSEESSGIELPKHMETSQDSAGITSKNYLNTENRSRYSMNYQSYEATRIQPGEQTRRMLDYMFPGYQKRDPRNWYEMQTQTDLGGDEVYPLIGTELIEGEPIEYIDDRNKSFGGSLVDELSDYDGVTTSEKKAAVKKHRSSIASRVWEGPPIKMSGKASQEGFLLEVDDFYHEPQTIMVPRDVIEHQELKMDIVPDDLGVPKVIVYLGDKDPSEEKLVREQPETIVLYDGKDDFDRSSDDATSEHSLEKSSPPAVLETEDDDVPEEEPHGISPIRDSLDVVPTTVVRTEYEEPPEPPVESPATSEPSGLEDGWENNNSVFLEPIKATGSHEDVYEEIIPVEEPTPVLREPTPPPREPTPPPREPSPLPVEPATPPREPTPPPKESTPPPKEPSPPPVQPVMKPEPPLISPERSPEPRHHSPVSTVSIPSQTSSHIGSPPDRLFGPLENYPNDLDEESDQKIHSPSPQLPSPSRDEEEDHPLRLTDDYPPQYSPPPRDESVVSLWLEDNVLTEARNLAKSPKMTSVAKPSVLSSEAEPEDAQVTIQQPEQVGKISKPKSAMFRDDERLTSPRALEERFSIYYPPPKPKKKKDGTTDHAVPVYQDERDLKPDEKVADPAVNEWLEDEVLNPAIANEWVDKVLDAAQKSNQPRVGSPTLRQSTPTAAKTPVESVDESELVGAWIEDEIVLPAQADVWVAKKILIPGEKQSGRGVESTKPELSRSTFSVASSIISNLSDRNVSSNTLVESPIEPSVPALSKPSFASENRSPSLPKITKEISPPTTLPKEFHKSTPSVALLHSAHRESSIDVDEKEVSDWISNEVLQPAEADAWVEKKILQPAQTTKWVDRQVMKPAAVENFVDDKIVKPASATSYVDEKLEVPAKTAAYLDENIIKPAETKRHYDITADKSPTRLPSEEKVPDQDESHPPLSSNVIPPTFFHSPTPNEKTPPKDESSDRMIDGNQLMSTDKERSLEEETPQFLMPDTYSSDTNLPGPFQPHPDTPDTPKSITEQPIQPTLQLTSIDNEPVTISTNLVPTSSSIPTAPQSIEVVPTQTDQTAVNNDAVAASSELPADNIQLKPDSKATEILDSPLDEPKSKLTLLPITDTEQSPQPSSSSINRKPSLKQRDDSGNLSKLKLQDPEPERKDRASILAKRAMEADNYLLRDDEEDYSQPKKESATSIGSKKSKSSSNNKAGKLGCLGNLFKKKRSSTPPSTFIQGWESTQDSPTKDPKLHKSSLPPIDEEGAMQEMSHTNNEPRQPITKALPSTAEETGKLTPTSRSGGDEIEKRETPMVLPLEKPSSQGAQPSSQFSDAPSSHGPLQPSGFSQVIPSSQMGPSLVLPSSQVLPSSVPSSQVPSSRAEPSPQPNLLPASSRLTAQPYSIPISDPYQRRKTVVLPEELMVTLPSFPDRVKAMTYKKPEGLTGKSSVPNPPKGGIPIFPDYKQLTEPESKSDKPSSFKNDLFEDGPSSAASESQPVPVDDDIHHKGPDSKGFVSPTTDSAGLKTISSLPLDHLDSRQQYKEKESKDSVREPGQDAEGKMKDLMHEPNKHFETTETSCSTEPTPPGNGVPIFPDYYGINIAPDDMLAEPHKTFQPGKTGDSLQKDSQHPIPPKTPSLHQVEQPTKFGSHSPLQEVPTVYDTRQQQDYAHVSPQMASAREPFITPGQKPSPLQSDALENFLNYPTSKPPDELQIKETKTAPSPSEQTSSVKKHIYSQPDKVLERMSSLGYGSASTHQPKPSSYEFGSNPYSQVSHKEMPGVLDDRIHRPLPHGVADDNMLPQDISLATSPHIAAKPPIATRQDQQQLSRPDYPQHQKIPFSDGYLSVKQRPSPQSPSLSSGKVEPPSSYSKQKPFSGEPNIGSWDPFMGAPHLGTPTSDGVSQHSDNFRHPSSPYMKAPAGENNVRGGIQQHPLHDHPPWVNLNSVKSPQKTPLPTGNASMVKHSYNHPDQPLPLIPTQPSGLHDEIQGVQLGEPKRSTLPVEPGGGVPLFPDFESVTPHQKPPTMTGDFKRIPPKSRTVTAADKKAQFDKEILPIMDQIRDLKRQMYELTPQKGPPMKTGPLPSSLQLYNELEKRTLDATKTDREAAYAERKRKVYEENVRRKIQRAIEK